jgi:hypothetical protein
VFKFKNPDARPRRVKFSFVLETASHFALQTPSTKTGLDVKHPMHYPILLRIIKTLVSRKPDTVPKKIVAVTLTPLHNPIIRAQTKYLGMTGSITDHLSGNFR